MPGKCACCNCVCNCAAADEIASYKFEVKIYQWGEKMGGKVSARSEKQAKELVRNYLRNVHSNDISAIPDAELLNYIQVSKYERSEEVFEFWQEAGGGE